MIDKWNLAVLIVAAICSWAVNVEGQGNLFCYYGSWSVYRPGNGKFDISKIQPNLCTHLVYAFAAVDQNGNVKAVDPWQDLADNYGLNGFQRFNDLKKLNSNLKTLLAIGGWNHGSETFSVLASSPVSRKNFVNHAIEFVKKYGFDGIDLAWLYPNQRGGHPWDVANYNTLLKELYAGFRANQLILSVAVGAVESLASVSYNIGVMHQHLDYINLMSYDMRGVWDGMTGVNAPLHAAPFENGPIRNMNVESAVKYWLKQGAPPSKIILGVPLFGKSFTLQQKGTNNIGAPIVGAGPPGPYTNTPGTLSYMEICSNILNGWKDQYDSSLEAVYAYSMLDNQWVGYEDQRSIKAKVMFARAMRLGGVNAWEIDFDDFLGTCGKGQYPLLNEIKWQLKDW